VINYKRRWLKYKMKRSRIDLILLIVVSSFLISNFYYSFSYAFDEVYRIPLRVHLGKSKRPVQKWPPILEEINHIWLSQAGICFEMEIVLHDDVLNRGMDIWFVSGENEVYNGMFRDEHDIWTKDTPNLRPALNPARYPAARTAAHELGHGLGLMHNGSSDNYLMQSQTYGWELEDGERVIARSHAEVMAHNDRSYSHCREPEIKK
jgi:hypothetical protein